MAPLDIIFTEQTAQFATQSRRSGQSSKSHPSRYARQHRRGSTPETREADEVHTRLMAGHVKIVEKPARELRDLCFKLGIVSWLGTEDQTDMAWLLTASAYRDLVRLTDFDPCEEHEALVHGR